MLFIQLDADQMACYAACCTVVLTCGVVFHKPARSVRLALEEEKQPKGHNQAYNMYCQSSHDYTHLRCDSAVSASSCVPQANTIAWNLSGFAVDGP